MRRALLFAIAASVAVSCAARPPASPSPGTSGGKTAHAPGVALIDAASSLGNVDRVYLIDAASSYAPGRGVERTASGSFRPTATACAVPRERAPGANVDPGIIDFGFIGVAVDDVLVGADVDLASYFGGGGSHERRKVSIEAVAFVRDLDPQFFDASDAVAPAPGGCACAGATHFIGAVKLGGLLAYDLEVTSDEAHGRALDFFRARLSASDSRITQRSVGGLTIDGLDAMMAGAHAAPLRFHVANPVPIAYALHPIADVCKLAFPEPEITPAPVDFGDVPYGREASRLLHVVNRAPFGVQASYHGAIFDIDARASLDIEARWSPDGDRVGCSLATREESIAFAPVDPNVVAQPQTRAMRVVERVRTGAATVERRAHADTGESRSPSYEAASRKLACPPDYALASCKVENASCGGGGCNENGYSLTTAESATGCAIDCNGPKSLMSFGGYGCRYDAVIQCQLRCP